MDDSDPNDAIGKSYRLGKHYHDMLVGLIAAGSTEGVLAPNNTDQLEYQILAIRYLENAIEQVGTCVQQITKIKVYLLLARLYSQKLSIRVANSDTIVATTVDPDASSLMYNQQEYYFYKAIQFAQHYLWKDWYLWETTLVAELKQAIIDEYALLDQNSGSGITIPAKYAHLTFWNIKNESNSRRSSQLKMAADTEKYLKKSDSSDDIFRKLEATFGKFRLCIIHEESNEIVVDHWSESMQTKSLPPYSYILSVHISSKPINYLIGIDYGSQESLNRPKPHNLTHIIDPILKRLIQKKENEYSAAFFRKLNMMRERESQIELLSSTNDYRSFVSGVVADQNKMPQIEGSEYDDQYINDCLKAIDICRMIMRYHARNITVFREHLPQVMEHISGGNINRSVLNMVRDMILLHAETMNGTGFPYNLVKNNILLVWRIYAIIRAYEFSNQTSWTDQMMRDWARGWHLDSEMLEIFLSNLKDGPFPKIVATSESSPIILSEADRDFYLRQVDAWDDILKTSASIGDSYRLFQEAEQENNIDKRNLVFLRAKWLRGKLWGLADTKNILVITRHWATPSDIVGWPPGKDDESLTPDWIGQALRIWEFLKFLRYRLFAGPLPRTMQTAVIMRSAWDGYTGTSLDPIVVPALKNPRIRLDTALNDSHVNISELQQQALIQFLRNLTASPGGLMSVIVSHKSIIEAAIDILESLYSAGVTIPKLDISHDGLIVLYFRGGTLIEEDDPHKGLLFPLTKWKWVLEQVNLIARQVFGDDYPFYESNPMRSIDLIRLHDLFLDHMNAEDRKDPLRLAHFIEELNHSPLTRHFSTILRAERVIK